MEECSSRRTVNPLTKNKVSGGREVQILHSSPNLSKVGKLLGDKIEWREMTCEEEKNFKELWYNKLNNKFE